LELKLSRRADSAGVATQQMRRLGGVATPQQMRRVGGRLGRVLVVNRFRVDEGEAASFADSLEDARTALAIRPGYVDGSVGRNVDDPTLWVLQTRWADVGSYRRALSAYEVKLHAVPLLSRALDEPSAYEIVDPGGVGMLNESRPRDLR
ncbi:MAG: antibiotic biosynthesis monooxygenase family protein, partial [Actinomycetota bacterium]